MADAIHRGITRELESMAKIIDLKTRKVLADLPSIVTPRLGRGYRVGKGELQGKLGIIAHNDTEAGDTFHRVSAALAETKKKVA
jgi:hypothetical protein